MTITRATMVMAVPGPCLKLLYWFTISTASGGCPGGCSNSEAGNSKIVPVKTSIHVESNAVPTMGSTMRVTMRDV